MEYRKLVKISSFTDLEAWRISHQLVLSLYKITKDFPHEEKFSLTDQIRRAGVSITSNIAEGFSRESYKEKLQFYSIARGSISEIQSQLLIARDLNYLSNHLFTEIAEKTIIAYKLLSCLVRSTKQRIIK